MRRGKGGISSSSPLRVHVHAWRKEGREGVGENERKRRENGRSASPRDIIFSVAREREKEPLSLSYILFYFIFI